MGASATERIALLVETRADLSGTQAARTDVTALGKASREATGVAAAGMANLTVSTEQMGAALKATNGDLAAATRLLAGQAAETEKVTAKTEQSEVAIRRMALAQAAAIAMDEKRSASLAKQARLATIGPQLGPGLPAANAGAAQLGPALPGLTTATAAAASANAASLDKVEINARKAGNAMNIMAASAAAGQGSVAGLATAAGNVAQELAAMSTNAGIAASAAGIGVLIGAIGVLIATAVEAKRALKELPEGKLAGAIGDHLKNLHTEAQIKEEIAQIDARRAALQDAALSTADRLKKLAFDADGIKAGEQETKRLQLIADLDAAREAALVRQTEIKEEDRQRSLRGIQIEAAAQTTATGRYRAQLRLIEAERIEAIRTHQLTEAQADEQARGARYAIEKTANDQLFALRNAAATEGDKLLDDEYQQRRRAIERETAEEKRANEDRTLSDAQRSRNLEAIETKRYYQLRQLEKQHIKDGLAGYGQLSAAVKNHGTVVGAMAKASADAVRIYEIAVQGKKAAISAKVEWAAAMAAFGAGNIPGGALHLAAAGGYAAAAVAAGAEAAGVVSGGGGGPASGDGGVAGSGTTFTPRDASGAVGAQTLVLQTVNPFSKEVISEAIYQINRSNTLKRPILIAPTTGLVGAA